MQSYSTRSVRDDEKLGHHNSNSSLNRQKRQADALMGVLTKGILREPEEGKGVYRNVREDNKQHHLIAFVSATTLD